ncbi:MAG: hypothetical protein HWQ43_14585 [Nostoc sp. JL31]|nr:hypothetical protein [Nostoc sp. JL31]MBN3890330.1 hypothetical protein [Nostoc sp. JL31]
MSALVSMTRDNLVKLFWMELLSGELISTVPDKPTPELAVINLETSLD